MARAQRKVIKPSFFFFMRPLIKNHCNPLDSQSEVKSLAEGYGWRFIIFFCAISRVSLYSRRTHSAVTCIAGRSTTPFLDYDSLQLTWSGLHCGPCLNNAPYPTLDAVLIAQILPQLLHVFLTVTDCVSWKPWKQVMYSCHTTKKEPKNP